MSEKQLKWVRDTAHEVNDQLGDDAETDEFIAGVLNYPVDKIPSWKTKDAVDKLKEWNTAIQHELRRGVKIKPDADEVVDVDPNEEIKIEDLPY